MDHGHPGTAAPLMLPRLILLSGKLGSGKSLATDLICDMYRAYQPKAFAHRIKCAVAALTGTTVEFQYSQAGKNALSMAHGRTMGELQQELGMQHRHTYGADIWVNLLFDEFRPRDDFWIVTDGRFLNEADKGKAHGALLIRLEGDPAGVRQQSKRDLNHPSETALDDYKEFHFRIDNSEPNLERLKQQLRDILERAHTIPGVVCGPV